MKYFFQPKFYKKPIDVWKEEKIIWSLKNKKSRGYDDIPISIIIKKVQKYISTILCLLINVVFISGYTPLKQQNNHLNHCNHLKTAKFIPLHKKDDTRDVRNYRAISPLPTLSKFFEKAVHIQLTELLERDNILDPNQQFLVG